MRIAIIDLGSNTFHLLIAEISNKGYNILFKTNVPVKLSEGKINDHIIIPAAFDRGIQTLKDFRSTIDKFEVDQVKAAATSAIRSASNGVDFVAKAFQEAQINIQTISGDEEAELIYHGVKLSGAITNKSLIMDIGGGSVEFILCDTQSIIWKKSYNVGAARLLQQFFKSNPLSPIEFSDINNHLKNEFIDLIEICKNHLPLNLIGSAGAFETFFQLIRNQESKSSDLDSITIYPFNMEVYKNMANYLIHSTHHERAQMPGMIPLRVDMIVMASVITNYIIESLNINSLTLSTYDLKMGSLSTYINLK